MTHSSNARARSVHAAQPTLRSQASLALALALCLNAGCAALPATEDPDALSLASVAAGSPEAQGIVSFVNDEATTFTLLDEEVGLDVRAARGLVDGRPFADIEEVDAVPYVGRVAMELLLAFARDGGYVESGAEARNLAIVGLVNDAATTFELLDDTVGLDRRAARNLMDGRPFANVEHIDAVPYVGAAALDALAAYGLANGYSSSPGGEAPAPCAIVSEYVEGQGNNNKAFEITNCGGSALDLASVGTCLVRNGDTGCGPSAPAGAGTLAAGAAWVLCRTKSGTFNDPMTSLVNTCDEEVGAVAFFNGDDRIVLFHDLNRDGARTADEPILDAFGDPAQQPSETLWADAGYRRCDRAPFTGGPFDVAASYTVHTRHDHTHLGVPAEESCGAALGAAGDNCENQDGCETGLRCQGLPNDGSVAFGKCIDPSSIPGDGDRCDQYAPCNEGLICAGWTLWGEGTCNPQWMAGRFRTEGSAPIHDAPAAGILPSVAVYGLASVPVDIEVVLEIDHPRPSDLRVTLIDPNGTEGVLWDRSTELGQISRSFVPTGISRDDEVNGRWSLRIEDVVSGETGTWRSFQLFLVSRWD